ncbi:MAG: Asp23/Gls24 family envelope stress response protein [Chloroflexi bacterium]|nr:Asp23/Gls24 family envelope stress response protein [Chloroflexota bacterium]MCL5076025.1 Asp23/Gls24 family envelope stress response protein [Chloroflexota bacterium]
MKGMNWILVGLKRFYGKKAKSELPMEENRQIGRVEVSARAISNIAARAVIECYGVVGMASHGLKDRLARILRIENYRRGVEVKFVNQQIVIDLYVIIEYGTRISEVAHNIASNVKFIVEKSLGLPVVRVNVNVRGLRVSQD